MRPFKNIYRFSIEEKPSVEKYEIKVLTFEVDLLNDRLVYTLLKGLIKKFMIILEFLR